MQATEVERYKQTLLALRKRVSGEVSSVAEGLREEVNQAGNESAAPVHLADQAPSGIDADVHVLETEQSMLRDIEDALNRIGDGTFGLCTECGSEIAAKRLQALPHAPLCITCAREQTQLDSQGSQGDEP